MSGFSSKIYPIEVQPHPNADRIEIARVRDYQSVVLKDEFQNGDLVAYIPEQSIVPDDIIQELGLEGKLSGGQKNRVKAIRLRGVLSQGLVYPVRDGKIKGVEVVEGQDVTDLLGLTKWEPPIPESMDGEFKTAYGKVLKFDVENIKMWPDVFYMDEEVVVTEKLHGTFVCFGRYRGPGVGSDDGFWRRLLRTLTPWRDRSEWIVHSKGLGEKGLAFKLNRHNKKKNVYVRIFHEMKSQLELLDSFASSSSSWFVCGEIIGKGVQDLRYGESKKVFAAFDMFVTDLDVPLGKFLDHDAFCSMMEFADIDMAPVLFEGPYEGAVVQEQTSGRTAWRPGLAQIREGCVIKPRFERRDLELGRVILKSVSEKYLTRKGGTEHN